MFIFNKPGLILVQHDLQAGKLHAEMRPLSTTDLEQIRLIEPDTWRLLTLVYGEGPVFPQDIAVARLYSDDFFRAHDDFGPEDLNLIYLTASSLVTEHESKFNDATEFWQSHATESFILSNLPVVDEGLQKAALYLFKAVKKMLDERRKWQQALNEFKQPPFTLNQNSLLKPISLGHPSQHSLSDHGWRSRLFNLDNMLATLFTIIFFGFIIWMGYISGMYRLPEVADATGFHVTLPTGYDWTALGKSEWISRSFGTEPKKVTVHSLKPTQAEAIKHILEREGTKISLPAGKAYRLVVPRRGAFFLPTGEVGVTYLIDTISDTWLITSIALTETEADAMARSFAIP